MTGNYHTRILCTIGVLLWSMAVAGQPQSSALPASLAGRVKNDRWDTVSSIRGLPLGVRDALQTLFGTMTLDIAEPGARFQGSGNADGATLPSRRLIAAGCSQAYCLVYYERSGGRLVALFHWTPAETRFEWGGVAPGGLKTIDAVRQAVLSGAIKSSNKSW